MGKKKNKGFTLIEVVIVMIIISILTIIATPVYRMVLRKSMAAEGKALVMSVAAAQKVYYADHMEYVVVPSTSYSSGTDLDLDGDTGDICVDARANRYFGTFQVWSEDADQTFRVRAFGAGDAVGITVEYDSDPPGGGAAGVIDSPPEINVTGL